MIDKNRLTLLEDLGFVEKQSNLSSEKKPLIEVNGLSINFHRSGKLFEAVKNANIKIYENDILGVVGESGSGKTTLGRSILSLWDHSSGEVKIDGRVVPKKRIKSVSDKNLWVYEAGQMIFQDPTSSLNGQEKVLTIVSEGLKNFRTVEKQAEKEIVEFLKEIENLEKEIRLLTDADFKNAELIKQKNIEEQKKLLLSSNKKEFLEYIEDFSAYKELSEKLKELKETHKSNSIEVKKQVSLIKEKTKSDKILIKEDTQKDKEFFLNARKEEIKEFKEIEERFLKEPEKVEKRIDKRIDQFIKYLSKKLSKLDEKTKSKLTSIVHFSKDSKKLSKEITDLEKWLKNNQKVEKPVLAVIINIFYGLKILEKKLEQPVSEYNTRGFDFIYEFVDDKITDKINYFLELIGDLDKRVKSEMEKAKESRNEGFIEFQGKSLKYLNKYKEILLSLIDEYRWLRKSYKKWMLEDVSLFYKNIIKQNVSSNILQLSILTWKAENRIEYIKRSNSYNQNTISNDISKTQKELQVLESKYPNILESIKIVENIFEKELKAISSKISIEPKVPTKKELEKAQSLKLEIDNLEIKIDLNRKLLQSKELISDEIEKRVTEILKVVGLGDDAINKFPGQFSGGQKQRIGIARTLVTNPKFIIADEPISALDVSVQAQVINLLKDIHAELGLTMIFIAHDLEMVHYISNKIAVIYRGNIVEYGDADKVYKTPIHPYTKSLIDAMPSLKQIGKPLKTSDYKWTDHNYNEFSHPTLHLVEKDHYVFGTIKEIKEWKK